MSLVGCSSFEPGRVAPRGPQAVGGVLDLRSWDFLHRGAVSLGGEWDFAPAALLDSASASRYAGWTRREVPDFWKGGEGGDLPGTGCGTYRLRVLLPPGAPPLGIRNYTGYSAFEMEAAGGVFARAGRPAADRGSAVSAYSPGVSRLPIRASGPAGPGSSDPGEITFLFRTSNWDYRGGGIWKCLVLGDAESLIADQRRDCYIQMAIAATMAALALNSLIIFVNRRKERSYLFFGIFGLVLALRPLVTGEYLLIRLLPGIDFDLLVRLEYASAMLAVPAAMAFFLSFFPSRKTKAWALALVGPFVPFWLFIVFLPLYRLTWTIFAFYAVSLVAILLSAATILARAVFRRTQGGLSMFLGGCLLAVFAINDVLYSSHAIATANLFPLALVLFVVLQSYVLARRFTGAFEKVELLSEELEESNSMLKAEIRNATDAGARLEASLAEKEVLLKEVHHRVKNSLQIVSSIVALRANRTDDAEAAVLAQSIRERIRVISLANEKLYDIDSGDKIDLVDYGREVLDLAASSYGSDDCRITAEVESPRGAVPADPAVAIDFGLILTELVVNSLKHALLPKGGGRIVVSIAGEGDECVLEVRDDGPGFPEGYDPRAAESLGFKIVTTLLRRRRGTIALSRGAMAAVSCTMKLTRDF